MDIKQLECFVSVAKTLNFSQTAQQLYLSQPAVTGQIKSLENELDIILFQRNKRTVKLTSAGYMFYHEVKQIPSHCTMQLIVPSLKQSNV